MVVKIVTDLSTDPVCVDGRSFEVLDNGTLVVFADESAMRVCCAFAAGVWLTCEME